MDGYFTTLGGRILNPQREVSGLGLDGLQEVVFNCRLRVERSGVVARRRKYLILGSGNAPFAVRLTVGTLAGIGNLAY